MLPYIDVREWKAPIHVELPRAKMQLAFQYLGSLTGASVDECNKTSNPDFNALLTQSSEDDHFLRPFLPTRRSLEAYTRFQAVPEESLQHSVYRPALICCKISDSSIESRYSISLGSSTFGLAFERSS